MEIFSVRDTDRGCEGSVMRWGFIPPPGKSALVDPIEPDGYS
ncbi:hypothetical protein SAMN05216315_10384 [Nitrosospira sp. Nsp18]|nr:hypothetical protein SAMN05216315_10384 [Nitrosospira sp. Nsp18]